MTAETKKRIYDVLYTCGLEPQYTGFDYWYRAIQFQVTATETKMLTAEQIYDLVADELHINRHGVRQVLRYAIERVFDKAEDEHINYYVNVLHGQFSPKTGVPTVRQFMYAVAQYIKSNMEEDV